MRETWALPWSPACSSPRASGRCLCGAIAYEVNGPLRDVVFCHCTRCRRTHGHFAAYTACDEADLVLVGARGLRWYELDDSERGFCVECGCSVLWRRPGRGTISIAAGTLEEPTGLRPVRHIYTANAGDYYEMDDGLEQRSAR